MLAMLGEQFMVGEEICGAVVSIRFQEDILRSDDVKSLKLNLLCGCLELINCFLQHLEQNCLRSGSD